MGILYQEIKTIKKIPNKTSGARELYKEMNDEMPSLGNRADLMEKIISDIKDTNLEIMQLEEKRNLKKKELNKNYLTSS